jgi:queuosine precursor transporter
VGFSIPNAYFAMMLTVAASNYLVQFPINDWLTYGAFPYPISFLVTELTNCLHGPAQARKVVYVGFFLGVCLSLALAPMRIAAASGAAFLVSQLLDIFVFNKLRRMTWWIAPLGASALASIIDTALFWSIAMWGEKNIPLFTWAVGDFLVKLGMDALMLTPFRLVLCQVRFER